MASTTIKTCRVPKGQPIGSGAFSLVYRAICEPPGNVVAVKKSRISLRVKRTILRHEARVLQLLQGHESFPRLVGYARVPHFEYLAMELLGESVKDKVQTGKALSKKTVAAVGTQMLSALEHMHSNGLVHRDIKPENILLCPSNASRVRLIDFGITRPFRNSDPPPARDPQVHRLHIVGTLNWCSINSHKGIDLGPRDDLESLAYVLLFLFRGSLPWRFPDGAPYEPTLRAQARVKASKQAFNPANENEGGFLGELLRYARGLKYGEIPAYNHLKEQMAGWESVSTEPQALDWTPVPAPVRGPNVKDIPVTHGDNDDEDLDEDSDEESNEEYSNSYFGLDIDCWDDHAARDKDVTLPADLTGRLDGLIPVIEQVVEE